MIEVLAYFIIKHAAFFEAYGNLVLIPLIVTVFLSDYLVRRRRWKKVQLQHLNTPSRIGYYSNEKWMNLESFRQVTIILDKEGIIREYKFGRNSLEEFRKMVDVYL